MPQERVLAIAAVIASPAILDCRRTWSRRPRRPRSRGRRSRWGEIRLTFCDRPECCAWTRRFCPGRSVSFQGYRGLTVSAAKRIDYLSQFFHDEIRSTVVTNLCKCVFILMLALESRCTPLVIEGVLLSRTRPNGWINKKRCKKNRLLLINNCYV